MIDTKIIAVPKDKGGTVIYNNYSNVSSSTSEGGSGNEFEPHFLWGQYFDDTQDINGDLTSTGTVTANNVVANNGIQGSQGTFSNGISAQHANVYDITGVQGNFGTLVGTQGYIDGIQGTQAHYTNITGNQGNIDGIQGTNLNYTNITGQQGNFDGVQTSNLSVGVQAFIKALLSDDITCKNLTVTEAAHFFKLIIDEIKATQGQVIVTPANATIDLVEEIKSGNTLTGWRCYFKATDGDKYIHNMFETNDQIIRQTFNAATGTNYDVSNTFWWRICTNASTTTDDQTVSKRPVEKEIDGETVLCHWIDIDKTNEYSYSNAAPAAGDEIVMLGNRNPNKPERKNAIVISAYANSYLNPTIGSPSIVQYSGINNYDLESHAANVISPSGNKFVGSLSVVSSSQSDPNDIMNLLHDNEPWINEDGYWCYGNTVSTTKAQGPQGANGSSISISNTSIQYQVSNSGTTTPSGTWSNSVPSASAGQYIWARTIVTYSDNTSTTTYSVSKYGNNGTSITISSTSVTYAVTDTNSQPADSAFTYSSIPALSPGQYLWVKEIVTYSDSTSVKSYAVSRIGSDGDEGQPGANGKTTHWAYATNNSGANFSTTMFNGATWVGTYDDTTTADSTNWRDYTWTQLKGDQGPQGPQGDDGTSVSITSQSVQYARSNSGTTTPSSWSNSIPSSGGRYLWTKTTVSYSDGHTTNSYSVGYDGVDGTSVTVSSTSVTYAVTNTSTQPADSSFTYNSIPSMSLGQYLWCKEIVNFSDGESIKSYSVSRIGEDGEDGTQGANGSCTHFAYATNSSGANFSTTMFNGATWIGTYTDTTVADSTNWRDYSWTQLKGDQGPQGPQGDDGESVWLADLNNEMDSISCDDTGHPVNSQSVSTTISLYYGTTAQSFNTPTVKRNGTSITLGTATNGVTVSYSNKVITVSYTNAATISGKDTYQITFTKTGVSGSWALTFVVNGIVGDVYNLFNDTDAIRAIQGANNTYTYNGTNTAYPLSCGYTKNVNGTITTVPAFIGDSTNGNQIDGRYQIFFAVRYRDTQTWQKWNGSSAGHDGDSLKYSRFYGADMTINSTLYQRSTVDVNTFDAVRFIITYGNDSYIGGRAGNIPIIDEAIIPVIADGEKGSNGRDGITLVVSPPVVVLPTENPSGAPLSSSFSFNVSMFVGGNKADFVDYWTTEQLPSGWSTSGQPSSDGKSFNVTYTINNPYYTTLLTPIIIPFVYQASYNGTTYSQNNEVQIVGAMEGADGQTGPQGATGPQGNQGDDGASPVIEEINPQYGILRTDSDYCLLSTGQSQQVSFEVTVKQGLGNLVVTINSATVYDSTNHVSSYLRASISGSYVRVESNVMSMPGTPGPNIGQRNMVSINYSYVYTSSTGSALSVTKTDYVYIYSIANGADGTDGTNGSSYVAIYKIAGTDIPYIQSVAVPPTGWSLSPTDNIPRCVTHSGAGVENETGFEGWVVLKGDQQHLAVKEDVIEFDTLNSGTVVTIKICSSSENNWDYMALGVLDQTLTGITASTIKSDSRFADRRISGFNEDTPTDNSLEVNITVANPGHHTIQAFYAKDGSTSDGLDLGAYMVYNVVWMSVGFVSNGSLDGYWSDPIRWNAIDGAPAEFYELEPIQEKLEVILNNGSTSYPNGCLSCQVAYNIYHVVGDTRTIVTPDKTNGYHVKLTNSNGATEISNFSIDGDSISFYNLTYQQPWHGASNPIQWIKCELVYGSSHTSVGASIRLIPVTFATGSIWEASDTLIIGQVQGTDVTAAGLTNNVSTLTIKQDKIETKVTQIGAADLDNLWNPACYTSEMASTNKFIVTDILNGTDKMSYSWSCSNFTNYGKVIVDSKTKIDVDETATSGNIYLYTPYVLNSGTNYYSLTLDAEIHNYCDIEVCRYSTEGYAKTATGTIAPPIIIVSNLHDLYNYSGSGIQPFGPPLQHNVNVYTFPLSNDTTYFRIRINMHPQSGSNVGSPSYTFGKFTLRKGQFTAGSFINWDPISSSIMQTADQIKLGVERAGINLTTGKITSTADKFEWKNNNGDTLLGIGSDGNATFSGTVKAKNFYHRICFASKVDSSSSTADYNVHYYGAAALLITNATTFKNDTNVSGYVSQTELNKITNNMLIDLTDTTNWPTLINQYNNNAAFDGAVPCVGDADIVVYTPETADSYNDGRYRILLPPSEKYQGKIIKVYNKAYANNTNVNVRSCINSTDVISPKCYYDDEYEEVRASGSTGQSISLSQNQFVEMIAVSGGWTALSRTTSDFT